MKNLFALLFLLLPGLALANSYQAGKQYEVVNEKASSKPEVREYFSYYCPHCFRFDPILQDVVKKLPKSVPFHRNHVDFLGGHDPKIQQMLSKALVVAEKLGMEEKFSAAVFNYIHIQRADFSNEKDIRNVFVLQGGDGDKFDKLMKSFTVNSIAGKMKKNQDYFAKKRALTGVPTIIVNNKYKINTQELDRNDPEKDLLNLMVYLSKLK